MLVLLGQKFSAFDDDILGSLEANRYPIASDSDDTHDHVVANQNFFALFTAQN